MAVGVDRRDRHRPGGRLDPGLREQPAGHQCLGERHRRGGPAGGAQHREPVEQLGAGAAERVGHPGQGQPGFFERIPQRLRPMPFLGGVDRRRLAQIGEDAGRGIDDDVVCHDPCWRGVGGGSGFSINHEARRVTSARRRAGSRREGKPDPTARVFGRACRGALAACYKPACRKASRPQAVWMYKNGPRFGRIGILDGCARK